MKFLVIQTAFLGDVILATAVIEKLHSVYPEAQIDFLLRKGNEGVLENHPFLHEMLVLDKKKNKFKNLLAISGKVRRRKYDYVINLHRFGSSGFITWRSGAKARIGFDKNPFSLFYTRKVKHEIGEKPSEANKKAKHEIERNHELIEHITDWRPAKPKMYPTNKDFQFVNEIKTNFSVQNYICIAPASVWFTKQFPKEKWIEFIKVISPQYTVFLIGAPNDYELCEEIRKQATGEETGKQHVVNLAGKLSLLQTAALMKDATMNYVNDSAPLHIASAMNAPTTAIFCSTIPAFGFGPLADHSIIIETKKKLNCRPCGLHGYNQCPLGHFDCAYSIEIKDLITV